MTTNDQQKQTDKSSTMVPRTCWGPLISSELSWIIMQTNWWGRQRPAGQQKSFPFSMSRSRCLMMFFSTFWSIYPSLFLSLKLLSFANLGCLPLGSHACGCCQCWPNATCFSCHITCLVSRQSVSQSKDCVLKQLLWLRPLEPHRLPTDDGLWLEQWQSKKHTYGLVLLKRMSIWCIISSYIIFGHLFSHPSASFQSDQPVDLSVVACHEFISQHTPVACHGDHGGTNLLIIIWEV